MPRPNGVILWEGPSLLDGSPLVVVATGLHATGSANRKTGALVQTWILRADMEPTDALRQGHDVAQCGDCPLRSRASGGSGACYVNVGQAPLAVFRAYRRGRYPRVSDPRAIAALMAGRFVRLGSYGDPAAVPAWVWQAYTVRSSAWTGYTHQWRRAPQLRSLCMASADSPQDARDAWALGWRTFRVARKGDARRERGEARCPASAEAGFRVTCETCPIRCDGARARGVNVVIQAHGATASRIEGD